MKTTKLIEGYLEGSLNEDERTEFEEELASDRELQLLVRLHYEVNQSIRDEGLHKLKDELEKIRAVRSGRVRSVRLLSVAAAVIIIPALAFGLRLLLNSERSPLTTFNKYYTPYEVDFVMRSEMPDDELDKGLSEYSEGNYAEAIQIFTALSDSSYMIGFYRGIAYLGNKDFAEAIAAFREIPEDRRNLFSDHRDWYLSLALIATGNYQDASVILAGLQSEKGMYSDRAGHLLRMIR
jgi:tetratricopeptide (TPR) repeat protein